MKLSYQFAKRAFDIVASGAGLLLLIPLLALCAAAVKVTSPGPVLFRHQRIGRHGVPFWLLKFRSMAMGGSGPQVTSAGDPRVTGAGRLLRRYKLDELPQLWNVLLGEMSLVGPRPEVARYVECFPAEYSRILTIKPGITDFAAIEYRDEEEILASASDPEVAYVEQVLPAKIKLYFKYLEQRSMATDLRIVFATIAAVLR